MQPLMFGSVAALLLAALAEGAFRGRTSTLAVDEPAGKARSENEEAMDSKAFKKDWGKEWKNGDFPRFEDTVQADGYDAKAFEDSQSDGKPSPGLTGAKVGAYLPYPLPQESLVEGSFRGRTSTLITDEPSDKAGDKMEEAVDHEAFKKDWGKEWRSGDVPRFEDTVRAEGYDAKAFEDEQSDGEPSPGLTGAKVGAYLPYPLPQESFVEGSFRERTSLRAIDEPSDKAGSENEEAVDHEAFKKDWGKEWRNGDVPRFEDTVQADGYDAKAFEDRQSDGKPSPGLTGAKVGAHLPYPLPQDSPAKSL